MPKLRATTPEAKVADSVQPDLLEKEMGVKAHAFVALQDRIKELSAQAEVLKTEMKAYLEKHGQKQPNGNLSKMLDHLGAKVEITSQLRVTSILEPDAEEQIKKKFPQALQDQVLETIVIVREDRIKQALLSGEIEEKVISNLYTAKENYAFTAKRRS